MRRAVVNGRWVLQVPDGIADWDALQSWERSRFESMARRLSPGMVLADVGAEHGWQSAIYASSVGGGNVHLFEPEPSVWPNIRATWEANRLEAPAGTFVGFVGDEDRLSLAADYDAETYGGEWPQCATAGEVGGERVYRYLHDEKAAAATLSVRLDTWFQHACCDAITVDVEGAEHLVVAGARELLLRCRPFLWVSVHPDLMERHFGADVAAMHDALRRLGYRGTHLGTDHEEHWLFHP